MRIPKKVWPKYFEKLLSGEKKVELRLADFACSPGDILVLQEWDPETQQYTGRTLEKKVTYVLRTKDQSFWKKDDVEKFGFQVISLE